MDRLLIKGGRPLRGLYEVSGSKNATLPLMAAACLADTPTVLSRAPRLADIETMTRVLLHCGVGVRMLPKEIRIEPDAFGPYEVPYDIVRKMRASIYMLGPNLARHQTARISMPGGCAIGTRPIDLHLKGMAALGAEIIEEAGYIEAKVSGGLKGADLDLLGKHGTSMGATINVMMAAVLAEGVTTINHAAREPEVVEAANFLKAMGANIVGAGTGTITIEGVKELNGVNWVAPPDRIEAGTYMAAAIATGGEILVDGVRTGEMLPTIIALQAAGGDIEDLGDGLLSVSSSGELRATDITTEPHPGFPTDMQAQLMALLTAAPGVSKVKDTIYPKRFIHVAELLRMGAQIEETGWGEAEVHGGGRLSGAEVMASDLRASAALVVAGLMAEGTTIINRIYHLDRGYECLERKLTELGAYVERLDDASPGENIVAVPALPRAAAPLGGLATAAEITAVLDDEPNQEPEVAEKPDGPEIAAINIEMIEQDLSTDDKKANS